MEMNTPMDDDSPRNAGLVVGRACKGGRHRQEESDDRSQNFIAAITGAPRH